MATLAAITPTYAGAVLAKTAATAAGDKFLNTGTELLYVINGGGGSINVTLDAKATPGGLAITDPVVAVAAGAEKVLGPFNPAIFNDANGFVNLTYSGDTDVEVAVLKVAQ